MFQRAIRTQVALRAWSPVAIHSRLTPSFAVRLASSSSSPLAPSTPGSNLPPRPQKHKAKKSKAKLPLPTAPSLTVKTLSPSTPNIPSLLPLGLNKVAFSTPSDGQAVALTSAERYDTETLLKGLQALGLLEGAVNLLGEAIFLPRWSPGGAEVGEVFIFESGTIVTWGLTQAGTEAFLRKVIRGSASTGTGDGPAHLGWIEHGRYNEPETEVLDYWVGKSKTTMVGDSIHLSTQSAPPLQTGPAVGIPPSQDLLARLAFSAGMARVTKLGVHEEEFDAFAEGVAGIPKLLESGSESPVKKTDIIKRVGKLHGFRQKLNLEDENLLEEPEFLWEDATLHGHYTAVCKALDFHSRLRNLNDRVDYAFQLQSTLMELLNTKTSHFLEWIIIILIAFEISIVLLREGLSLLNDDESDEPNRKRAH